MLVHDHDTVVAGKSEKIRATVSRGEHRAGLFPSDENPTGHQKTLKTVWHPVLRRAKVPYFRIYDLRSTYGTRLSAGSVADEWVTQLIGTTASQPGGQFVADTRRKHQERVPCLTCL